MDFAEGSFPIVSKEISSLTVGPMVRILFRTFIS